MLRIASFSLLLLTATASLVMAGPMGGSSGYRAVSSTYTVEEVPLWNTTLLGEKVLASQVVCRNRWGTPMLPDGKGGYSLIARVNPEFIALSNVIPPAILPSYTSSYIPYRVRPTQVQVIVAPPVEPVAAPAQVVQ